MAEFALGPPCGRGRIRAADEDFRVVEQLGYTPSGEGEHLWLEVEKRDWNTLDVARFLAEKAGVPLRHVGFAGLKDRHAVTRQPFTIHLAGRADPAWPEWQAPGIRIVSGLRHRRKIQRGRLAGNRFELVVRDFDGDRDRVGERLVQIERGGVPNRFGEQRFGGNNIARAHRMFRGELQRAPSRAKRGFYLSAARSLIFNHILDERIRRADWNHIIDGDVLNLDGSRSRFAAGDDPALAARVEALDLHPTGPLFGVGALARRGRHEAELGQPALGAGEQRGAAGAERLPGQARGARIAGQLEGRREQELVVGPAGEGRLHGEQLADRGARVGLE